MPKVASTTSPSTSLIKDVCVSTEVPIDYQFCIQVLNSEPRVVSASDLSNISIAVIEAGISNVKNSWSYVKRLLKQSKTTLKPDCKYVSRDCATLGTTAVIYWSFRSALGEVKDHEHYSYATYDLKIMHTDNIDQCRNAQRSRKVRDVAISKGNEFMPVFGAVALIQTVSRLESNM